MHVHAHILFNEDYNDSYVIKLFVIAFKSKTEIIILRFKTHLTSKIELF
jgi:hypothetical protein